MRIEYFYKNMSFEALCKICFKESKYLLSLSTGFKLIEGCQYFLSECLMAIAGLDPTGCVPIDQICEKCQKELINAYSFRLQTLKALETLKSNNLHKQVTLSQTITLANKSPEELLASNQTKLIKSKATCAHCSKTFSTKKNLSFHLLRKHFRENLAHLCSTCGKKYANKTDLQYHESTKHRIERNYVCHLCSKAFNHKKSLDCHMTSHSGERNVKCTKCEMAFKTQGALYNHEKRHTITGQQITCQICNQNFVQKVYYIRHVKLLHSSMEKHLFKCEDCGKLYKHKISLEQHQRIHTGDLFACTQCTKSYKSKSKLNDHIKVNHHTGQYKKQFSCTYCSSAFFINSKLNRHLKSVHKVEATLDNRKFLKVAPL